MSEYAYGHPPKKRLEDLDNTGTLFEGLGKRPEVSFGGVYITLDKRAEILEELAKLYGQRNKARGAGQAIQFRGDLNKRYKDPNGVVDAMAKTALGNKSRIEELIAQLTMEEELRNTGFGYDATAKVAGKVTQEIMDSFGEGSSYARRQKHLRPIRKAAKIRNKNAADGTAA